MSPLAVLVAGLLVASVGSAEAKRMRLLPGTKPAAAAATAASSAAASSTAASASTAAAAAVTAARLRRTLNQSENGEGAAATAQDGDKAREALGNAAWTSESPAAPAKPTLAANLPNPDARQLPVLGIGGGDMRPVKGFVSLN